MNNKKSIINLSFNEIKSICKELNYPEFHASQILDFIYKKNVLSFDEMSSLPKDLRLVPSLVCPRTSLLFLFLFLSAQLSHTSPQSILNPVQSNGATAFTTRVAQPNVSTCTTTTESERGFLSLYRPQSRILLVQ